MSVFSLTVPLRRGCEIAMWWNWTTYWCESTTEGVIPKLVLTGCVTDCEPSVLSWTQTLQWSQHLRAAFRRKRICLQAEVSQKSLHIILSADLILFMNQGLMLYWYEWVPLMYLRLVKESLRCPQLEACIKITQILEDSRWKTAQTIFDSWNRKQLSGGKADVLGTANGKQMFCSTNC